MKGALFIERRRAGNVVTGRTGDISGQRTMCPYFARIFRLKRSSKGEGPSGDLLTIGLRKEGKIVIGRLLTLWTSADRAVRKGTSLNFPIDAVYRRGLVQGGTVSDWYYRREKKESPPLNGGVSQANF